MIPYGRQNISDDDIASVISVLKSDFLTQGNAVTAFENAIAHYCGSAHAIAANSATSCLHIACLALGVGAGDVVWTAPNTFVASANAALYCGATVDFVDIDPNTYCMSATALEKKLAGAQTLPKVVIPVHFSGHSCDMEAIHALAKKYGFQVIEDASHCIGASYAGKKVGSCAFSDIAVFSFHPVKIITTGEGGVACTNNPELAERMALFRSHGVTRDPKLMEWESEGGWYYQQVELGYNYRITDIQCALGLSQLNRLDDFVAKRRALAARYHEQFDSLDLPIKLPLAHSLEDSSWHLYVVQFHKPEHPLGRKELFTKLRESGIGTNVHYIPVHLQPYYQKMGFKRGNFPVAEAYYQRAITLPLFQDLTETQQNTIVKTIHEVLRA